MGTNFGSEDGYVIERMKSYLEARTRGGAGLIIVEVTSIDHPRGASMPRQIGISRDEFIPGLKALMDVIHRHGAKVGVQLIYQHNWLINSVILSVAVVFWLFSISCLSLP